jgi:DNA replication protein
MNNYNKLKNNLEKLKLDKINENMDNYIDLVNKKEKNIVDALYELTEAQVNFKDEKAKMSLVRTAGFPYNKTFEDFDFTFQPSVDKEELLDLKNLRFINKKENILLIGSSGVGKTHLAISIGIECAKNRLSTYFITCYDLIQKLKKASLENRLLDKMKVYEKYSVLIIDEIGYLPIEVEEANLLFQLINKRYEKNSTIVTSNISFDKWGELFKDNTIASAMLDRLLHHSNIFNITGNSYRIKDKFDFPNSNNDSLSH